MNIFGTHHFRLQEPGIRYELRQPPLWMKMNMWNKKCWCGKIIKSPQRKYCCYQHSQLWFYSIRAYWDSFRLQVIRRDNYTCQECGIYIKGETTILQADHILAICLGGMCYDLENIRTLCNKCHLKKTAQDMKKLSYHRKANETVKLEAFR